MTTSVLSVGLAVLALIGIALWGPGASNPH